MQVPFHINIYEQIKKSSVYIRMIETDSTFKSQLKQSSHLNEWSSQTLKPRKVRSNYKARASIHCSLITRSNQTKKKEANIIPHEV